MASIGRREKPVAEIVERGSVLRLPASEAAIEAKEDELDFVFSPSYRSFLLISDGANAGTDGPDLVLGAQTLANGFWAVARVRLTANSEPEFVATWADTSEWGEGGPPQNETPGRGKSAPVDDHTALVGSVVVAKREQRDLDVVLRSTPPTEGQFWSYDITGARSYLTFADLMLRRTALARLRADVLHPTSEALTRHIEAASVNGGGGWLDLGQLIQVYDQRALMQR